MTTPRDLTVFAGYGVSGICKETGSGAKRDRAERLKIMALAQSRQSDVILVDFGARNGHAKVFVTDVLLKFNDVNVSSSF